MSRPSILIVGAGGFIGGFIVAEAVRRGFDTYAAVRQSTSRRYITDPAVKFVVLDYDDADSLGQALREAAPASGRWDYIIYNLGATKCANFGDFNRINYLYLRDFVTALEDERMLPDKFLYLSSLSALGSYGEADYAQAGSSTVPSPNTRYGLSKIKAETFLQTRAALPWIIFRPTGVYGPHEQDYLMMVKCIDRHFDFGVGYRRQLLTFIYVEDLVAAMFDALASDKTLRKKYIISEPRAYTQKEFRSIVAKALGRKFVLPVKLPMWAVYVASVVAEKIGVLTLKPSTLNRDKFKIMRQRNWTCSVADAVADFGFTCRWPLEKGIDATVEAYLAQKSNK
ncbi:MAG: NAD-dependent epimerase/dehydratase family protein [Muribaculaceae bacterium]|nr:NAD-dependent epimerase/dehydratase family protein [Muribaculaceae bacterium]